MRQIYFDISFLLSQINRKRILQGASGVFVVFVAVWCGLHTNKELLLSISKSYHREKTVVYITRSLF